MNTSAFIATSLDGFVARVNGDVDWLTGDEIEGNGEDYGFRQSMVSVDALAMGHNTFEMVVTSGMWPYEDKRLVVLSRYYIST